jgi:hypothetical protein
MVRAITLTATLALLGAASVRAEIDLTPKESFYVVEGIKVPNITFKNTPKDITYSPPANWTLSGGGGKLTLVPLDSVQAGGSIQSVPTRVPSPEATEANVKAYSDLAAKLVPSGASKVEVVEAQVCPMRISGKAMIEVTLSYSFYGQPFKMNVLFMPREKEELRFQFSSRASDYAKMFKDFRGSLFSMQGL